jgi:hypothetical protein
MAGFAIGHGFCIRTAGGIAAFRALGLRQQVFELVSQGFYGHGRRALSKHPLSEQTVAASNKKAVHLAVNGFDQK